MASIRECLPRSIKLTLYTTPVVYLYLDRLRQWSERRKQRRIARRHHDAHHHAAPARS